MDVNWFLENHSKFDWKRLKELFDKAQLEVNKSITVTATHIDESGHFRQTANTSDISKTGIDNATNLVMQKILEDLKGYNKLNNTPSVTIEIKDNRYNTYERIYTKIVPKIRYNIDDQGLKLYNEAVEYTIKHKD